MPRRGPEGKGLTRVARPLRDEDPELAGFCFPHAAEPNPRPHPTGVAPPCRSGTMLSTRSVQDSCFPFRRTPALRVLSIAAFANAFMESLF